LAGCDPGVDRDLSVERKLVRTRCARPLAVAQALSGQEQCQGCDYYDSQLLRAVFHRSHHTAIRPASWHLIRCHSLGQLHLAAFRTGRLLSQSELARDARPTSATVANYLSLLEVSGQEDIGGHLVEPAAIQHSIVCVLFLNAGQKKSIREDKMTEDSFLIQ